MDSAGFILGAMITPAMAYAGLGAAALPILIHLFNRRRFRRIRWAATDFLLEAERRNRRRTRLEEMILLALRCLAMALLGLALARWFVQPESLMASLGSAAHTDQIIVVDDSFSMGATNGDSAAGGSAEQKPGVPSGSVFAEAKQAAQRLIEHIRQSARDDSVTILLTSRPDRPVRLASAGQVPAQAWTDDIEAMQVSSRAANWDAAMKSVRDLLDARKSTVRAAVYVISDFQAIDWLASRSGPDSGQTAVGKSVTGPAAALAGWAHGRRGLELLLIDVGRTIASNLSVAAIHPEQAQAVAGVVGRYKVRIESFGAEASRPGELQVFMGDAALPPVPVPALAPGQSADLPIEVAFGQEGSQRLIVQLPADGLAADNQRSCAVPVERALRLLIVNGEASPDPYQDEAFLLNVALRPEGPEFSGNETVIINEDEFEVANLADYHAVLLLNVNRVTQEMANRLEQFAAAGGGVVFFLGDQVDGAAYNRLLYRDGGGILPARLGDQVTVPADKPGVHLAQVKDEARGAMRFGSEAAPLLSDTLVWQYFGTDLAVTPASEPARLSALAGKPPVAQTQPASRPAPRALMRLDDPERNPLLVERPFGRGRVMMFTTSADKEWNNLPDQPVYVVMMMELMQYVARPSDGSADQVVGRPIRLAIDPAAYEPSAMLKLPTYPGTPAVHLDARPNGDTGQNVLEWTDTDRPGLYRFDLRKTGGDEVTRQVAVNLETRESDVRHAARDALLASMGDLPVSYVRGEDLADRTEADSRQELWPGLLAALVAILMLEQGLAWWFGSDRNWSRAVRWTAS